MYGGNNPLQGLDCSGFVCLVLRSCGVIKFHEDLSAQGLYEKFKANPQSDIKRGDIVFYGPDSRNIQHVAIAINDLTIIESAGGNHLTTSIDIAKSTGACVKLSWVKNRKDQVSVLRPSYPWEQSQNPSSNATSLPT